MRALNLASIGTLAADTFIALSMTSAFVPLHPSHQLHPPHPHTLHRSHYPLYQILNLSKTSKSTQPSAVTKTTPRISLVKPHVAQSRWTILRAQTNQNEQNAPDGTTKGTTKGAAKGAAKKASAKGSIKSKPNKKSTAKRKSKSKSKGTSKTLIATTNAIESNNEHSVKTQQQHEASTKSKELIEKEEARQSAENKENIIRAENEEPDQEDQEDEYYANQNIPTTGYSLYDQLQSNSNPETGERFVTALTAVYGLADANGYADYKKYNTEIEQNGHEEGHVDHLEHEGHEGVARIDTLSTQGGEVGSYGEEPVRWLVSLGPPLSNAECIENSEPEGRSIESVESYVMIDVPPYSKKLEYEIRSFMDPSWNTTESNSTSNGTRGARGVLKAILLTSQNNLHYSTSPGVYSQHKSDLSKWTKAFPGVEVIMYRLDIPRECRGEITGVLDGYGPWGWSEGTECKFIETGRPLTVMEWDEETKIKVLKEGEMPPDDKSAESSDEEHCDGNEMIEDNEDDDNYSLAAIKKREEQHRLLAVYTPGHTFGSVTYIFPKRGICCSGCTLPLETSSISTDFDDYDDDYNGYDNIGSGQRQIPRRAPRLDYQGYLATSASRSRQMSSAMSLINNYIDRFSVVLPSRGDAVFLEVGENGEGDVFLRKRELMESVGLYKKIGDIYGRLGIVQ